MDALSQALVAVRATGAIFFRMECKAPWGVAIPNANDAAPLMSPGTERVVDYHLVTQGRVRVQMEGGEEFRAEAGDIVLLPHGTSHIISNGRPGEIVDGAQGLGQVLSGCPATFRLGGEDGETTQIICGFIGCERSADRLFLAGLPNSIKISLRDGLGDDWILGSLQHLVAEAELQSPGSAILLSRMAEALFVEALRRFMQRLPAEHTGWLAGASDPVVSSVLALLHRTPEHNWTLNELAREAGASRSVLAKRFSQLMEETPAAYLRRWRLHLAAGKLRTCGDTVLQVAADVGYESEAAFNRAFRIEFGLPPAQYRRHVREGVQAFPAGPQP